MKTIRRNLESLTRPRHATPELALWESESEVGGEAHALKGSSKESYSLVRHVRKTNEVQQIKAHEELMFAKSTDNDESVI